MARGRRGGKEARIIGCREQGLLIQMTIQLIILCCIFYTLRGADRPFEDFDVHALQHSEAKCAFTAS